MSVHISILVLLLIYILSLIDISSTECVPVFMWGNIQYSESVSPLKKINQELFADILENQLEKESPLVIFVEQTLSPEDFNSEDEEGKSIFPTLAALKSTTVNYLSCVKNPIVSITSMKERNSVKSSVNNILNGSVKIHAGDILLVDMNDANEDEDRVDMLHRHDRNMALIYEYLMKDHKDIVMVYTAYRPSWIISEEVRSHRHIRDVSKANDTAEPEIKYLVIKNDDILISAYANPLLVCNETIVTLDSFLDVRTLNKTDEGMDIVLKSETITHITLTLEFHFMSGYWILSNIAVVNTTAPEKDREYYFRVKELYAPELFSYHCSNQSFYYPKNPNQHLTFQELQIQPFLNTSNLTFGTPYDCVGFMSAPIWSGLFVTFILVLIMTCGLTMMMDIKTMDRFDDPKGKTITVTATE